MGAFSKETYSTSGQSGGKVFNQFCVVLLNRVLVLLGNFSKPALG